MANLVIHIDGKIQNILYDCKIVNGNVYKGTNGSIKGVGRRMSLLWTRDAPEEGQTAYELTPVEKFYDKVVDTNEDVDNVINNKIKERYPVEEELKLHRLKLSNNLDEAIWNDYVDYVTTLVNEGKTFKATLSKEKV